MSDSLQSINNDAFTRKRATLDEAFAKYDALRKSNGTARELAIAENDIQIASRAVAMELTHPGKFALDVWLEGNPRHSAVLIAIELGIFELVKESTNIDELAKQTGADKNLLRRVMRTLAAAQIFDQNENGDYIATKFSHKMAEPAALNWIKLGQFVAAPVYASVEALRNTNFIASGDPHKAGFAVAYGRAPYEVLESDVAARQIFNDGMAAQDDRPREMYPDNNFPFSTYLSNSDQDKVIFVDVGGGNGSVIRSIQSEFPDLVGRFVLLELPSTIAEVEKTHPSFEYVVGDFFKELPALVKGAQVYHLRRCLHNWSEENCRIILKNVRAAMTPAASRLLIHEFVVPPIPKDETTAHMLDMVMMALTGREREEDEWRETLESSGLKLVKIWRADIGDMAIIEAIPQ